MKRSFLMGLLGATTMAGAAMLVLPNDAHAALITSGTGSCSVFATQQETGLGIERCTDLSLGSTIEFARDVTFDTNPDDIISFSGSITVTQLSSTALGFNWSITNNGGSNGYLNALGLSVDYYDETAGEWHAYTLGTQTGSSGGSTLTLFDTVGNLTQGLQFYTDVCIFDPRNCQSGGPSGLAAGESDSGSVTLSGNFSAGLALDTFGARYTGFPSGGSYSIPGNGGTTPPPTDVPEPMSLALFGVGLLGLGCAARRRKHPA